MLKTRQAKFHFILCRLEHLLKVRHNFVPFDFLIIVHLKFPEPGNVEYNEVFLLFCNVQGF